MDSLSWRLHPRRWNHGHLRIGAPIPLRRDDVLATVVREVSCDVRSSCVPPTSWLCCPSGVPPQRATRRPRFVPDTSAWATSCTRRLRISRPPNMRTGKKIGFDGVCRDLSFDRCINGPMVRSIGGLWAKPRQSAHRFVRTYRAPGGTDPRCPTCRRCAVRGHRRSRRSSSPPTTRRARRLPEA